MLNTFLKTAALALVLAAPAVEAREMRVSSFEPPQGFYSSKILQAWIDEINPKLSEGNAFKLYPGSMLGAPPAQAELVKAGVADVALVVPTYTPGLFPNSGVVELPGMVTTSAGGTNILNTLAEEGALDKEYADYKIVALFTTPGYRFFMTGKAVTAPGDLSGLKLRSPSKFGSTLFDLVGASGVSVPAPQVYENLERGVVQGAVWVMDAYRTFRLNEVAPYVTDTRFTAQPMAILMNKAAYESLSDADRAVLDDMTGRATAEWIAGVVDATDAEIEAAFRADGKVTFTDLDADTQAKWDAALADAPAKWLAEQADPAVAEAVLIRAGELGGK
ncbi:TRAP transporter substrate-binding protein [Sinirhodobacter sp. WL0062]|uniref:TRAP transporter substrate-binding protein n=1 Tax=Rhodobacter flavimaris TaxID=2907145 RepID=A0ABS8YTF7_9RHOB|nr:TRAP transporter substrate-binding protein [Sinirhodobacter sp. WL0062]MCE5973154.1 TRAP transporter substrate-binding protein [Sinirhodobacter sp. WL0062]